MKDMLVTYNAHNNDRGLALVGFLCLVGYRCRRICGGQRGFVTGGCCCCGRGRGYGSGSGGGGGQSVVG